MPFSDAQRRRGFLLPDKVAGHPTVCVQFEIPDTPEYRAAVRGHIQQLASWTSWEKSWTLEDRRATTAALIFRTLIDASFRFVDTCGSASSSGCIEHLPSSSIIEWHPNNPYTSPDLVPDGYAFPPWYLANSLSNLTLGTSAGDVVSDIFRTQSIPVIPPASGYPRFRVHMAGEGTCELHLVLVNGGGYAQITTDDDPFTVEFVSLSKDVISVPPETSDDIIIERVLSGPGEHHIDVLMIPLVNDELPVIGFGGAVRKVVLCGFDMSPTDFITDVRLSNCGIEVEYGRSGVYVQKISPVELSACFGGESGDSMSCANLEWRDGVLYQFCCGVWQAVPGTPAVPVPNPIDDPGDDIPDPIGSNTLRCVTAYNIGWTLVLNAHNLMTLLNTPVVKATPAMPPGIVAQHMFQTQIPWVGFPGLVNWAIQTPLVDSAKLSQYELDGIDPLMQIFYCCLDDTVRMTTGVRSCIVDGLRAFESADPDFQLITRTLAGYIEALPLSYLRGWLLRWSYVPELPPDCSQLDCTGSPGGGGGCSAEIWGGFNTEPENNFGWIPFTEPYSNFTTLIGDTVFSRQMTAVRITQGWRSNDLCTSGETCEACGIVRTFDTPYTLCRVDAFGGSLNASLQFNIGNSRRFAIIAKEWGSTQWQLLGVVVRGINDTGAMSVLWQGQLDVSAVAAIAVTGGSYGFVERVTLNYES